MGDDPPDVGRSLTIDFQTGLISADRSGLALTVPAVAGLRVYGVAAVRAVVPHEAVALFATPRGIALPQAGTTTTTVSNNLSAA